MLDKNFYLDFASFNPIIPIYRSANTFIGCIFIFIFANSFDIGLVPISHAKTPVIGFDQSDSGQKGVEGTRKKWSNLFAI